MLTNWEDAQNSLTTALISSGSALREFEKYMDSIEYKSGVLRASVTELWANMEASDTFKRIIDFGIAFVQTLDVMVNQTDFLGVALLGLSAIIIGKVIAAIVALDLAAKKATISVTLMSGGLNLILPILAAVTLGYGVYSASVANAERKKREFIETTKRNIEMAESEAQASEALASQYDKLKDKVGETEDGKKKLDQIIEHLIRINPDLKDGIDGQKISYDNLSEAIQRTINKKRELAEVEREELARSYRDELKSLGQQRADILQRISQSQQSAIISRQENISDNMRHFHENRASNLNTLKSELENIDSQMDSIINSINELYSDVGESIVSNILGGDEYAGGISSSLSENIKLLSQFFHQLESIARLEAELSRLESRDQLFGQTDESLQNRINLIKQIQQELHQLNNARREELSRLEATLPYLNKNSNQYTETWESISKLRRDIESTSQSWYKYEIQIKNLTETYNNELIKSQEEVRKKLQDLSNFIINEEIASLQRQKQQLRENAQIRIDAIQKEIDSLQSKNNLLKEQEEREKRLTDLAKQREKVENIKRQRNVRILQDGEFVWIADPRLLRTETERLQEMQEDYFKWEREIEHKRKIEALQNQIKEIREQLKNDEQSYDRRIRNLQDYITHYNKQTGDFYGKQIEGLKELIREIESIEGKSYEERIRMYENLVNKQLELMNKSPIPNAQPQPQSGTTPSAPSGGTPASSIPGYLRDNLSANTGVDRSIIDSFIDSGNYGGNITDAIRDMRKVGILHEGGIAGQENNPKAKFINSLFKEEVKPNEILMKLLKGEVVVNPELGWRNFIPNMQNLVAGMAKPAMAGGNQVFNINKLEFPNVKDSNEIKKALIELPRIALQYSGRK